jgi:hypothetical protein
MSDFACVRCPVCMRETLRYSLTLSGLRCTSCGKVFIDSIIAEERSRWLTFLVNSLLADYTTEEMREPYIAKQKEAYDKATANG